MNCKLIECDRYLHKKGHYVLPQTHTGLEIIFYLRGSGTTTIGGEKYAFKSNDVIIIPPNTEHDELFQEDGCVLFCIVDYEKIDFEQLGKTVISENRQTTKNVYEVLNRIIIESMAENGIYHELIEALLQELLLYVYRLCEQEKDESEIVSHIKKYIKLMYIHPINFDVLSAEMGYSYDHLRHIFKKNVGITMKQYLTNVRIEKAQKLLIKTDYSIERIAFMCGYGGVSNFIVSFKNSMNITPSQYRKNLLNAKDKTLLFDE